MKDYANISYVNEAIDSLVREVVREKREAIESQVWSRYYQIQKLLDGGRDILTLSSGDNFRRLYEQRRLLWEKSYEMLRVIEMISKVF